MSSERFENTNAAGALDAAIDSSLQEQPTVVIPADFAARVAAKAATMPRRSRVRRADYARRVVVGLSVLLVVALFALAPHAEPSFSSLGFDLEMTTVALLCGLLYWLARTRSVA